ncbi:MAG TPA: wax ester/triacylglycerol synthase family O-acyltransferase [Acidimicrobiales bacterium]|nr:wax ester/triacylglycerol synthase family O-acyltransferase [Acidimicrobiales bacterium]
MSTAISTAISTDRLSMLDSAFLWLEHPGRPIHIGAVATFEAAPLLDGSGRLRIDEIRDRLAGRLDELPVLRRRLAGVRFGADLPRWTDDADFDIARHVVEQRLPAGSGDDTLRQVAGELHSQVLPRDRPLWEMRFLTGLDGGRVGMVERVHHAMVDGVSGVDVAAILLDVDPDAPARRGPPWSPAPAPDPGDMLAAGLRTAVAAPWQAGAAVARLVRDPIAAARAVGVVASGLGALVADRAMAPPTSLNRPPSGARRIEWLRADVSEVRAAGRSAGASVNDVVLSAVAGGLRSLLLGRGEQVPADAVLKVLVPVSRRPSAHSASLGNRVAAIDAPLPIGIGDPERRLAAVAATMRRLKSRPEAALTGGALDAADLLPAPAGRIIARALERQRLVNLVVTNVPGPPVPLYAAGARMLEAFPVVAIAANLTVGVAVLSYAGALTITLTADTAACPDVGVMAGGIGRSLAALGAAPGAAPGAPR